MRIDITKDNQFLYLSNMYPYEMNLIRGNFTKEIDNAWFLKKKSKFIETTRCFVSDLGYMPVGLWVDLLAYCKQAGIPCEYSQDFIAYLNEMNKLTLDDFKAYVNDMFEGAENEDGKPFAPYEYQVEAAYNILKYKCASAEISTSAGKTLISFIIFKYILEHNAGKCLYIVPSVDLATQSAEKFELYESYLKKHPKAWTTGILKSGLKKAEKNAVETCDILFGTFQSLANKEPEFFDKFKSLIGDECHHISAVSIRKIIGQCKNLEYKIGVTGTYQKPNSVDNLNMKSYYGPHVYTLTADSLINKEKSATPIYIVFQILSWATEDEKQMLWQARNIKSMGAANIDYTVGTKLLRQEQAFINASFKRLQFISEMAIKMKNNTLLLFGDVKNGYGKHIYNYIRDYSGKQVYYIDGTTSNDKREYYKQQCEEDKTGNTVLVASIGTFGEGIDISNIGSIFLVNSAKSERIIRQICGRGLRLCPGKDKTVLYDFVDDMRYSETGKYYDNYMWTHYKERKKIYKEQNFPSFEQNIKLS